MYLMFNTDLNTNLTIKKKVLPKDNRGLWRMYTCSIYLKSRLQMDIKFLRNKQNKHTMILKKY